MKARASYLSTLGVLAAGIATFVTCAGVATAAPRAVTAHVASDAEKGTVPHVMVIMMENTDFSQAIGSPEMPYLNELAHQYAAFPQSYGWMYPSLPNYMELLAGTTLGISSDCDPGDPGCTNLVHERFTDELEAAGVSWQAYYQDDVSGCDNDPADFFAGNYDVEHNAFPYFADFAAQCSHLSNFGPLFSSLSSATPPDYNYVVPDLDNDGGDNGTMSSGDTWLNANVPEIMRTRWYREGGQIVIMYDTGYQDSGGLNGSSGGRLPPIVVVSAHTRGMGLDPAPLNTAGVLRSLELAYGLPFVGDAADPNNGSLGDALVAARPRGATAPQSFTGAVVSTSEASRIDVRTVRGSLALNGLYRFGEGSSIEVGENAEGEGVVVTAAHGSVAVPGTSNLESVSCTSPTVCWAVGLATADSDVAALVKVVNGEPASVTTLPDFYALYGIACPIADTCEAVGYDTSDIADAVTTITDGVAGAPVEVAGGGEWLNAISCPTTIECDAVGLVNYSPSVVPIIDGTPQAPISIPNALYSDGIDCTSAGNCVIVGEIGNSGEGYVATLSGGTVSNPIPVPGTEFLYGVGCATDGDCLLAGARGVGVSGYSGGVLVPFVDGNPGSVTPIPDTNGLNQVECGATIDDCATVGAATGPRDRS